MVAIVHHISRVSGGGSAVHDFHLIVSGDFHNVSVVFHFQKLVVLVSRGADGGNRRHRLLVVSPNVSLLTSIAIQLNHHCLFLSLDRRRAHKQLVYGLFETEVIVDFETSAPSPERNKDETDSSHCQRKPGTARDFLQARDDEQGVQGAKS
ncbi:hypothetical protein OGATHE_000357 [Ogataea polymorpha]|uniref:Uncharacterized protein n=1 Tax=Ogataea polymorpha TaxID=460523 RepID=A0A9P8TFJ5_9ASCO|nr:hypothetical protein OGATHE_000357 [Ogataea polymorpha]